jgi:hypothetical protein
MPPLEGDDDELVTLRCSQYDVQGQGSAHIWRVYTQSKCTHYPRRYCQHRQFQRRLKAGVRILTFTASLAPSKRPRAKLDTLRVASGRRTTRTARDKQQPGPVLPSIGIYIFIYIYVCRCYCISHLHISMQLQGTFGREDVLLVVTHAAPMACRYEEGKEGAWS